MTPDAIVSEPTRGSVWMAMSSLVCALAIGVVVVVSGAIELDDTPRLIVWWTAYVLFLLALLALHGWLPMRKRPSASVLIAALAALAALLVALVPGEVWMPMLFVMTAAIAAFVWRPRAVAALVLAQIAWTVGVGLLGGWPTIELVLAVAGFGNLQVFGAIVVTAVRGEARARAQLAAAHAELQTTAALLELTTRETERLRIARDLHDIAGHHLTALALELEVAEHLGASPAASEHVERAKAIAKSLLGTIRDAVGQLRAEPSSLEPALRRLAEPLPGLEVDVRVDSRVEVDADGALAILRCTQEAITNAVRHAAATRLTVLVERDGSGARMTISDDGGGAKHLVPGHGLIGMRERFAALGGSLEVANHRGHGVTITGTLPERRAPSPGSHG